MKIQNWLVTFFFCLIALATRSQQAELVLPAGGLSVSNAEYSRDGKLIVTSSGQTGKIWDAQSGKNLYTLEGHIDGIESIGFSPDNKYVVTASRDMSTKIWDAHIGKVVHTLQSKAYVEMAVFSPNGKLVATILDDDTGELWDAQQGKLLFFLRGHTEDVQTVSFSHDSKFVVTASWDGTAKVWNAATGQLMFTLIDDERSVMKSAAFSPDAAKIITAGASVKLWDAKTGKLLNTIIDKRPGSQEPFDASFNADFTPTGKAIVTYSGDRHNKMADSWTNIWDAQTGKQLDTLKSYGVERAKCSPDGRIFAAISNETVELWSMETGALLATLSGHTEDVYDLDFSGDGNQIVTSSEDRTAKIWDVKTGNLLRSLEGTVKVLWDAKYSPDGQSMVVFFEYNILKIWDVKEGKLMHVLDGKDDAVQYATYSPDSKKLAVASWSDAKIWDVQTGKIQHRLGHDNWSVYRVIYSPDGKNLLTASRFSARIWDTQSGKMLKKFDGHQNSVDYAIYSPDIKNIATVSDDKTSKIWEATTGKLLHTFEGHKDRLLMASFNPDGTRLVTAGSDNRALVWDAIGGQHLFSLEGHTWRVEAARFSPDGKKIVTAANHLAKVWDAQNGQLIKNLEGHDQIVRRIEYTPDGKSLITASDDQTIKLWNTVNNSLDRTIPLGGYLTDIAYTNQVIVSHDYSSLHFLNFGTGKEMLRLAFLNETDWVVSHPSGLFDATPGAMEKLYFVQGLDIIDFNQLKERYYEPGLWKKVMAGEKLRSVIGMKSIELPPNVRVGKVDENGYLPIDLTNQGGGIGEVTVLINGKEAIADARPQGADSKATSLSIKAFVGTHKALVKGAENYIAVKAWNEGHWVVSRSTVVPFAPDGQEHGYKPAIHAIIIGVSDYTGTELDLKFAAKDADDIGKALRIGAGKLFGADQSYIYSLTTSQPAERHPTKANIISTFEKVSAIAHPLDIVVVYLSGHGINYGGQDGDWYYLTQDAYTASSAAYDDPEIRRTTTLSSNELVELFKKLPALKQVLMIDACASGKVVENLMAKKDIESTTLRALDRMRDRTGLHIITGCTANAVSYEASKYGQGVLTYSLLEGIRGAALREDQFVDVNKLFQYAHDRVPTLAEGIGGIQSPQVFSPQGGQSFDIGQLSDLEKKEIPIARIRPVYIRSTFIDDDQLEDALQLGMKVDQALNEAAGRGSDARLIFVDVRDYPEGCKLSGRYKQDGGTIKLKLRQKCDGIDQTVDLKGKTVDDVRDKVINILK